MRTGIIVGSHRQDSQSTKIGTYLAAELEAKNQTHWLLNMASQPLPFWDEGIWNGDVEWQQRLQPLSAELAACDNFIIIAPEWHGMVPAALKNFFLMWSKGELAHKPAMIVAVSSGTGGAYPVAELRMSSYKNNRICYMPDHVIVRNAEAVLNQNDASDKNDQRIRDRLDYSLNLLLSYSTALQTVRDSGIVDLKRYPSGM